MLWDKHVGQHDFLCNFTRFYFICGARILAAAAFHTGGMEICRIGTTSHVDYGRARHRIVSLPHDETIYKNK